MLKIIGLFFYFFYSKAACFLSKRLRKTHPPIHSKSLYVHSERSILFHASSVGELEVLTPLIEKCVQEKHFVHVSVFSDSAYWALQRLFVSLQKNLDYCGYFGFSPHEGEWLLFLERLNPTVIVTDRYEAWPDLWCQLSKKRVPLFILGAQFRKSLILVKYVLKIFSINLPQIYFFTNTQSVKKLKEAFSESNIQITGEIRLEHLFSKKQMPSPRVLFLREVIEQIKKNRKVVVLGSLWSQDFEVWKESISEFINKIFFVIVPHKLEPRFMQEIQEFCLSNGFQGFFSSEFHLQDENSFQTFKSGPSCLIVNEMGVLSELYQGADGAYIGGGFSNGVHSTLEPAVALVPIACGLKNIYKFPEIEDLIQVKQLTLVQNKHEIRNWLAYITFEVKQKLKEEWEQNLQKKCGATEAVYLELNKAFVEIEGRPH